MDFNTSHSYSMKRCSTPTSSLPSPADQRRSIGKLAKHSRCLVATLSGGMWNCFPNHRIVQAWRVVTWPEGVYSIAKFELKSHGSGTRLVFDHIGFPEGLHDHLAEGWESNSWMLLEVFPLKNERFLIRGNKHAT